MNIVATCTLCDWRCVRSTVPAVELQARFHLVVSHSGGKVIIGRDAGIGHPIVAADTIPARVGRVPAHSYWPVTFAMMPS